MTNKTLDSINCFDLEQNILDCWHVTDDIDTLLKAYLDGPKMSQDDVANVLLGLKTLYQLKFENCFNTFEILIGNDKLESNYNFNPISVLENEIKILESRIEEHGTGHIKTTISVLKNRIKELST